LSEGDEVVCEHPVYTPLLDVLKALNVKIKYLERRFEEGYNLNVNLLNEMVDKNTKMIVLTNLHNPSGAMMDLRALKAISEIADENKTLVLSDEVYRDFMIEGAPPPFSLLSELGISTCSVSKFYGAGALRVGWAMCDAKIVDKARKLNDYILAANSCAGETIGHLVLEKRNWFVEKVKEITSRNYPIVKHWVKSRDDLEWIAPRCGVIGFPRLEREIDTMELAMLLLNKYRTLISPGRFFGVENHFRIGFGGEKEKLEKGLFNVGQALDELS
jgi:aspartate/methionine/tyrosine aminotransferase